MSAEPPSSEWTSRSYPVAEDIPSQRRLWRAQRFGWVAMVLVIGLAIAGLFSEGPLSRTTVSDRSGRITVEAQRFLRNAAPAYFTVSLEPTGPETALTIGGGFADGFVVEAMEPSPKRSTAGIEGLQFVFDAPGEGRRLVVRLAIRPRRLGFVESHLSAGDGAQVVVSHLIYP